MIVYQENVVQSRSKKIAFSFICRIISEKYFYKSNHGSRVCITVSKSPNSPWCLDEAMEAEKKSSIA